MNYRILLFHWGEDSAAQAASLANVCAACPQKQISVFMEQDSRNETLRKALAATYDEEWLVLVEQDSRFICTDWETKTDAFLAEHDPDYFGAEGFRAINDWTWFEQAKWHRMINRPKGITHAACGVVGVRQRLLKELDWPDPRLAEIGYGPALGWAIHQLGSKFTPWHYGFVPHHWPKLTVEQRKYPWDR